MGPDHSHLPKWARDPVVPLCTRTTGRTWSRVPPLLGIHSETAEPRFVQATGCTMTVFSDSLSASCVVTRRSRCWKLFPVWASLSPEVRRPVHSLRCFLLCQRSNLHRSRIIACLQASPGAWPVLQ